MAIQIERKLTSGSTWTVLSSNATSPYVDSGVELGTSYDYRAKTVEGAESSAYTAIATVISMADTVDPSAPSNIQFSSITTDSVTITWNAATDNVEVDGYNIYLNGVKQNGSLTGALTYSLIGELQPDTEYDVTIEAVDTSGNATMSSVASFTTEAEVVEPTVPDQPVNAIAVAVSDSQINLSWDEPANDGGSPVLNYWIRFSTDGSTFSELVNANVGTTYQHTGLLPDTQYWYRIYARNSVNISVASSTITATTEEADTGLSPASHETINFASTTFDAEPEKTHYLVYYPEGYEQAADKSLAVMINLHGLGEYYDTYGINGITRHGTGKLINEGFNLGSIDADGMVHIVPIQPRGTNWENTINSDSWNKNYLNEIYEIALGYKVDPDKVYMAGLSMGGKGVMAYANEYPERIAGVVAIAPNVSVASEQVFKDNKLNVWFVHGELDSTAGGFGWGSTQSFYNNLIALSPEGDVKFSKPSGAPHDTWTKTYNNTGNTWTMVADGLDPIGGVNSIYTWLKSKEKESPAIITTDVFEGEQGVALNRTITFVSEEVLTALNGTALTSGNIASAISYKDSSNADKAFTATISGDKRTITVTPSGNLSYDEIYTITLSVAGDKGHDSTVSLSFESESSTYVIEKDVRLNFGNNFLSEVEGWNRMLPDTDVVGLQTVAGLASGFDAVITQPFNGAGNSTFSGDLTIDGITYPQNVIRGHWTTATFDRPKGILEIRNLNPAKYYEVIAYAHHTNANTPITRVGVQGNTAEVVQDITTLHNTTVALSFEDIRPDANGAIAVSMTKAPTSSNNYSYLSAVIIRQSNLPKP